MLNACFCCVRFSFFPIPSQMTGLGKRLRSDLFYVEWDVKPQLHQSFCHTCHCVNMDCFKQRLTNTHTHTLNGPLCPGLPGWVGTRRVKPIWILLKQETMSVCGVSWAICKSAPCFRQMTTPAPHHSVFYRLDTLPVVQPTVSKH